ncbi:MAG: hypothetical protein K0B02_04010 [DPANN group archaeon]|nr:hypothetical protein [DPANN group archaeon]
MYLEDMSIITAQDIEELCSYIKKYSEDVSSLVGVIETNNKLKSELKTPELKNCRYVDFGEGKKYAIVQNGSSLRILYNSEGHINIQDMNPFSAKMYEGDIDMFKAALNDKYKHKPEVLTGLMSTFKKIDDLKPKQNS